MDGQKQYSADYAKRVAGCKKCKNKLEKGTLRIAKLSANPFSGDGGDDSVMKNFYHPTCLFETFLKARATTKIIEEEEDIDNFTLLEVADKRLITKLIKETLEKKHQNSPKKKKLTQATLTLDNQSIAVLSPKKKDEIQKSMSQTSQPQIKTSTLKNDQFREFRKLCADISDESSYTAKTNIVKNYISKDSFEGDLYLVIKLLLPGVVKRVYNLNNKQIVKIFSQIFKTNISEMIEHLEQGDVADTIKIFYEKSDTIKTVKKSLLTIQEVDYFLETLSKERTEDAQLKILKSVVLKCTSNDLKMFVRLIKHDLRINAGAKHILDALDPNASDAFKASQNLEDVINRVKNIREGSIGDLKKILSVKTKLMTPIKPMLAEACRSVEHAIEKCPNGMMAEIKYDGERVQLHKNGNEFNYFSRSLKLVQAHKVSHFKDYIPKAFPNVKELILDCEVLLIDTKTSKPLPFGSLGTHKRKEFEDANVCLFVFDCIYLNGDSLLDKPLKHRREILEKNMIEIPNRILFSEMHLLKKAEDLKELLMKVFNLGLEGLVLKNVDGVYEPGKRHWLKVKKDYLASGAMADTADLIVLGGYFGSGTKGGIMSSFLMGVYNPESDYWLTVTKCSSGFDDKTLELLQKQLKVTKISKDFSKIPNWLKITKNLTPDFIVNDPKEAPIWEITGAEFSKSDAHTANGISIRFPRCTKIRDDKTWKEATDLQRLKILVEKSEEKSKIKELMGIVDDENNDNSNDSEINLSDCNQTPKKKRIAENSSQDTPKKKRKFVDEPQIYSNNGEELCTKDTFGPKNPLPNIFLNKTFFIDREINNYKLVRRYVIAFGGSILSDFEKDMANYILQKSFSSKDEGKIVSECWILDCIKANKVLKIN